MDKIQDMQDYGNLDGLLQILRQNRDPELRARAARALGELDELEASDTLASAAVDDPDPGVRQAARLGLHDLLGNQADMVLRLAEAERAQGSSPVEPATPSTTDAASIRDLENNEDLGQSPTSTLADYETLRGLIMIARGDPNRELRLRATKSLGQFADMNAVRELMDLAMWDEDVGIRQAAEEQLHARYGERLPEMLESYRREFEGDEEEDMPWESGIDPYARRPSQPPVWESQQQPKFEGASTIGCLILVFVVLAALYLLLR